MLRSAQRFFGGGGFPLVLIGFVVSYEVLIATLLLLPPADSALGAFAADFRVWCFGYDATQGSFEWARVAGMLGSPWVMVAVVWGAYSHPIRAMVKTQPWLAAAHVGASAVLVAGLGVAMVTNAPTADASELVFPADSLRTAHRSPPLVLTDHTGATVDLADERGQVVLLTAIYARCSSTCPMIMAQAKRVVAQLTEPERRELRVVGVTLDPDRDSPEVLAALAEAHHLSKPTWRLATGEPSVVNQALDDMGIARRRDPQTGVIDHANLFLVLDRSGHVAYRFGLSDLQESWLVEALRLLIAETSGEVG